MKVQRFQYAESGRMSCFCISVNTVHEKRRSAYVDKDRVKEPCKNVSEQILLGGICGEPDLCDPQRIRRIECKHAESYKLPGAECDGKQPG